MLEKQFADVFGENYQKGNIGVNSFNYSSLKQKCAAVEEVLFVLLASPNYKTDKSANDIWDGKKNLTTEKSAERFTAMYGLLQRVEFEIREHRELSFTQFKQFTYDENGTKAYAERELFAEDLVAGEGNLEQFEVWEKEITDIIRSLDGLIASEKFVDILTTIMKQNGYDLEVTDQDGDGKIGIYDAVLTLLAKFVFTDEFINKIFTALYPMVTQLLNDIPSLLKKIGITPGSKHGSYNFDLFKTLNAVGKTDLSDSAMEAIKHLGGQLSGVISMDGANGTESFQNFFAKNGIFLYPYQIAYIIGIVMGQDNDAYKTMKPYTSWDSILKGEEKELQIQWNVKTMDDFKKVLTVLFSSFGPLLEVFTLGGNAKLDLDKVASMSIHLALVLLSFQGSAHLTGEIKFEGLTTYQDIIVPMFEALGLSDFGTKVGDPSLDYKLVMPSNKGTINQKAAATVNAIIDPLLAFVRQLASHPIEKLLSIAPNLALMLENGKLIDLFDIGGVLKMYAGIDFVTDIANMFGNLHDIITDSIMVHWYDWLNPFNYVRIATAFLTYVPVSLFFSALTFWLDDVDLLVLLEIIDFFARFGTKLNEPMSNIINEIPKIFEELAQMLGLHISNDIKNLKWDGSGTSYNLSYAVKHLNFSTIINEYFASTALESNFGGLNFGKISTVIKLFLDNLVDDNGNKVTLIDTKLLDLDKLAHLGKLEKRSGSTRSHNYARNWNSLNDGEYYFVNADAADVLYYFLDVVCGTLQNKNAVKAILGLIGLDYDELSETVAQLGDQLTETTSLQLNSIVKDATDTDGKLSLDKIISHLSTNNVLCIISEFVNGVDLDLEEVDYIDSPNKEEIDANGGKIPYLQYNTQWTSDVASFVAEDIDNFVDELLKTLPYDIDPSTEDIETLREFAKPMIEKIINNPTLITPLVKLLSEVPGQADAMIFTLIEKATDIDALAWANDFGWLFDEKMSAPTDKNFEKLSAEKTADKDGNDVITWYYDGKKVETYKDIFAFLGELLSPVSGILDLVFCGKDFKLLEYDRDGNETGAVATVKGNDGYNFAILPVLEAMLPDTSNIPTPEEFAKMGTMRGLMAVITAITDFLMNTIDSETFLADLSEMAVQLMYVVSGDNVSKIIKNLAQPLFMFVDYLRPIINIDVNEAANLMICELAYEFAGYKNAESMRRAMKMCGGEIKLSDMTLERIFKIVGVFFSTVVDGTRVFLDVSTPITTAMNDAAYLKKTFASKGYALDGSARKGAKLDISGRDSLTVLASMMIETIAYKHNPGVIDVLASNIIEKFGLTDSITEPLSKLLPDVDWAEIIEKKGIIATVLSIIIGIEMKYSTDYNWLYVLGEKATDAQKEKLYSLIKTDGSVKAEDYQTQKAKDAFNRYLGAFTKTTWDEGTAVYLVERLGSMIDTALNIETEDGKLGDTLLELLGIEADIDNYNLPVIIDEVIPKLLTDDIIEKIVAAISDTLNGRENELVKELMIRMQGGIFTSKADNESIQLATEFYDSLLKSIIQYKPLMVKVTDIIGVDLGAYDIDMSKTKTLLGKVTYYNADGEKTGLTRHTVSKNADNFGDVIAEVLSPLSTVLSFVLLGDSLEFLNTDGVLDSKARRDALIKVDGLELYEYMLLPLGEALGVKGLKSAQTYKTQNDGAQLLLEDFVGGLVRLITDLSKADTSKAVLDTLFDIVPSALYYLNSDAIGVYLDNTIGQINSILDVYNTYSHREGEDKITAVKLLNALLGLNLKSFEDISIYDIIELIPIEFIEQDENGNRTDVHYEKLYFNDFIQFVLENFTTGEIFLNKNSKCTYDTYSMRYENSVDKAETITILAGAIIDLVEDPDNKPLLVTIVGDDVYQTIINMLNLADFNFEMQDFSWLFTEYADTNKLVSAFDFSSLFNVNPYEGKLWTREMAADLAMNLTQFINDMLYLLGLNFNGIKITDFNTLMYSLVGGTLYSNDALNLITSLLGQIKPLLDKYDPNGDIAGFVKELLDVDLHAWDEYTEGGKYANGRDWGFKANASTSAAVKSNSKVFEKALCELLSPVARLLTFVLCENDFTFFTEGDGLGKNTEEIQLTIYGAEGYKYALVPLLEAMNVDGLPEDLAQGKRDGDIYDPEEFSKKAVKDNMYAIEGVIHPIVSKVNDIMDSTATELLSIIPSIVYFINSNGIDTVVKNLIHSVYVIGNAVRPIGEQIDALVYDEYGINLYKTIDLENLLKNTVYGALHITEDDVKEIYKTSGKDLGTVDGLEDIDFRLLFSIGLAAVNNLLAENGLPFKFTSIAASAVEELTYGYVRSFDSLSGRKAYTMVLGKEINKYCYGDLISILMRIVLKFLSVDGNSKALVELLKVKFNMSASDEKMLTILTNAVAWYTGTLGGYEVVMLTLYYTIYGASQASGSGVEAYDKVNAKWASVVVKLEELDNPIAKEVVKAVLEAAKNEAGDVIGPDGVAPNGFIRFFQKIAEWFRMIIQKIKNLFKK